jgi:hypothetical protein
MAPARRHSTWAFPAAGLAVATALSLGPAAVAGPAQPARPGHADPTAADHALAFDPAGYTTIEVTIDGEPSEVRWYHEVCYVADPVLMASEQKGSAIDNPECGYQSMNVFVPEQAYDDPASAIYFAVNNSGWFASYVRTSVTDGQSFDSSTSNVGAALAAGYVFVDVATRSREVLAADGSWAGKAPAVVVDAKAAVRYLRLNDEQMPGSAERIVVNGTSGGGALAAILGASGNSKDYVPYLREVGAAGVTRAGRSTIRDDVFAVNAYCPITDLGNADIAYEWLYSVLDTRALVGEDKWPATTRELADSFADYQRSLHLRSADGSRLTARTMLDEIQREVVRSAEAFMAADPAHVIEGEDWIEVDNAADEVLAVDMSGYLVHVASERQLKPAPAFDQSGVTEPGSGGGPGSGESSLFGPETQPYSNFTEFGWNNNAVPGDASGLDDTGLAWQQVLHRRGTVLDEQLELIDPMRYIGTRADSAPFWYVRHGAVDRDTSLTVSLNLARALEADRDVRDVDYRLAWDTNHAGNYDVPEAMAWIRSALAQAPAVRP